MMTKALPRWLGSTHVFRLVGFRSLDSWRDGRDAPASAWHGIRGPNREGAGAPLPHARRHVTPAGATAQPDDAGRSGARDGREHGRASATGRGDRVRRAAVEPRKSAALWHCARPHLVSQIT